MIKKLLILTILLLICNACVSRTVIATDNMTGSEREVIQDKKLIWFWQPEFYK